MKTIKNRILIPFLILVTIIPLVTLIVFNFAIRAYFKNNAQEELLSTVETMQVLIKKELAANPSDLQFKEIGNLLNIKKASMLASKLSINTEVLVCGTSGEIFSPKDLSEGFLTKEDLNQIVLKLSSAKPKTIIKEKNFIFVYLKIAKGTEKSLYVVFAYDLNSANLFIRTLNIILFTIMFIGILISVLVSNMLSNRISKKMNRLCVVANNIGKGEFINDFADSDITEIASLSQSISEMSAKLSAYDKAQKTFLQDASHEVRTPLMSIQGYAEGISSGIMTDCKKAADIIISESKRLNALVDELLTLSRIENQTYSKQLTQINLNNSLKEYIQILEGLTIKTEKQLKLSLPPNEIYALLDDDLISKALINIVSNCMRYAKSVVIIELFKQNNKAVIRISDDGNGICETDLPHIFDRFYKGKSGNMGLGLAIAKSAVEFMGGTISAYNNGGAVFEIII